MRVHHVFGIRCLDHVVAHLDHVVAGLYDVVTSLYHMIAGLNQITSLTQF